jgi:hypothetical protein
MSETKRTGGTWVVNGFGGDFKVIARMDGHGVAVCSQAPIGYEIEDARFIVRACNAHDELVAALRAVTEDMDRAGGDGYGMPECPWCGWASDDGEHAVDCSLLKARAALSKAESR